MYYPILIIPFGIILTYIMCYICLKKKDEERNIDRIEKIFEKISSKKIIDILNNQEDYRTASSELDKKLLSLIKKEM